MKKSNFPAHQVGQAELQVTLADPSRHGIVNGGHTAAIRDAIENADDLTRASMARAHVRLHLLQGIDEAKVAEIAEGLNRSKQVDDPSLANLQGHFDKIREVLSGKPGAEAIAYHQGGPGDIYITEMLVMLELFNCERFNHSVTPTTFLNRSKSALEFYQSDLDRRPSPTDLLVRTCPILVLSDLLKKQTPAAAKRIGFEFGRMKIGKMRAGSQANRNVPSIFGRANGLSRAKWMALSHARRISR